MKNKKVIVVALIILIVLIIGTIIFLTKNKKEKQIEEIPSDYKFSITRDTSAIDGPNITLYIYDNEVIKRTVNTYPYPKGISIDVKQISITQSMRTNIDELIQYFENLSNQPEEIEDVWRYYIIRFNTNDAERTFYIENKDTFFNPVSDDDTPDLMEKKIDSIFLEINKLNNL